MRTSEPPVRPPAVAAAGGLRQCAPWLWSIAGAALLFGWPLIQLARFALSNDLYSQNVLVPFISAYFVWIRRQELMLASRRFPGWAAPWIVGGAALLVGSGAPVFSGPYHQSADVLTFTTAAFVLVVVGVSTFFFGAKLAIVRFPVAFLVFMVPMPDAMTHSVELLLQHGSAEVAYVLFMIAGMTMYREGLLFRLPGIPIEVAPECSGIHSTLALLITSVVAGQLFLRTTWARVALAVAVIPLALLRNGFRVFTIGELCVQIGPHMIDSPIHHKGGPLFFALSLLPFALLLRLLIKAERGRPDAA